MIKALLIIVGLPLLGWLGIVLFLILDKDKDNGTKIKTIKGRNNSNNNK